MRETTLRRLVGALLACVALAIGVLRWPSRSSESEAPPALDAFFPGADLEGISTVRMYDRTDTVELALGPDGWRVNGHRPDSAFLGRLWRALERPTRPITVVSVNPAHHEALGVSDDRARRVELLGPGGTRSLWVGEPRPRAAGVYVRLARSDTTYLLPGELGAALRTDEEDWRSRLVVALDTTSVAEIHLWSSEAGLRLRRGPDGWTADGVPANEEAHRILAELAPMRALGFFAPDDSAASRREGGRLTVLSTGGDTLAALSVAAGGGDRWVRADGDTVRYRMAGWRVDHLTAPLGALR